MCDKFGKRYFRGLKEGKIMPDKYFFEKKNEAAPWNYKRILYFKRRVQKEQFEYSALPFIGIPLLLNNSVLIRKVFFGDWVSK